MNTKDKSLTLRIVTALLYVAIGAFCADWWQEEVAWARYSGGGRYGGSAINASIVEIGDGDYSWGHSPTALGVEGTSEFDGTVWCDGLLIAAQSQATTGFTANGTGTYVTFAQANAGSMKMYTAQQIITIPVWSGNTPAVESTIQIPADAVVFGVTCRVTTAPGGGATTLDIGRTGGNTDEFVDGISTALGTTGTSSSDGDGTFAGPLVNASATTVTLTTDADVTGSDMKVRVQIYVCSLTPPSS